MLIFVDPSVDHIEWLSCFFVRKDIDLLDDEGDDNPSGEYWQLKDPKRLKCWSIALVPMTDHVNFVMKFCATFHAFSISADKCIKEVIHFKDSTLYIHCKTTNADPYSFSIALNNTVSPFTLVPFISSLKGLAYEPLMKEIKGDIDRKV